MTLKIEINMDNAAFVDDGSFGRSEAARILEDVARKLTQDDDADGGCYDINGNRVGAWKIIGR